VRSRLHQKLPVKLLKRETDELTVNCALAVKIPPYLSSFDSHHR
jgi:hypothetical protein